MGAPEKQDWRAARRRRAWELKQQGWKQKDIAMALGVSQGAISQWLTRVRTGGEAALAAQPPPGMTPKLTAEQRAQLPLLLAQGAEHYGYRGDIWTSKRVADVIQREFGVRYHPDHVRKLLHAAGWSPQRPKTRASQQDATAIATWVEERWPQIKKSGRRTPDAPLRRRVGLLLAPHGRADMGPSWGNAAPPRATHPRSFIRHQWDYA
jgi:transposase